MEATSGAPSAASRFASLTNSRSGVAVQAATAPTPASSTIAMPANRLP